MADDTYPPSAFYFMVLFGSSEGAGDTSFQEVSGITSEVATEEVREGGENRYALRLPTGVKHGLLELKRGIAPASSPLVAWCRSVFDQGFIEPIVPKEVSVHLLNEDRVPIRAWTFSDCYPVKWEVEGFGSTKNQVAIEKIVLSYTCSNRTK